MKWGGRLSTPAPVQAPGTRKDIAMTTILRTIEEIKAEIEYLKATRKIREDAAAVVANGDVDEAARRIFLVQYGRPYDVTDFTDSLQSGELEGCRSLVHNPMLVYDCDLEAFGRIVAELAAPGPERDARADDRAVIDGLAMRLPGRPARCTRDPEQTIVDPWAESDGERWELGPDEGFQPDPEDWNELAAMERPGRPVDDGFGWEEQEACRVVRR